MVVFNFPHKDMLKVTKEKFLFPGKAKGIADRQVNSGTERIGCATDTVETIAI